jgi:DNA polymerase III epsilon subunit-like protein
MKSSETLYCSLDLELTGFDPSRDTILEVGFVFFRFAGGNLEITEQWSQTFRPISPVHPKILGLTGLTQAELDAAPEFKEFREFLQDKIGSAILVGHNIAVDAGFLEAFGIKLSGRSIDTLDLVQWLLPTRHSYNLENLMHYFRIPHPEAHRALADSIAVTKVLEQLLILFHGFPEELQAEVLHLARQGNFVWTELFAQAFKGSASPAAPPHISAAPSNLTSAPTTPNLPANKVLLYPFSANTTLVPDQANPKSLVVVSDKQKVLELWRQGLVRGVFDSHDLFNAEKFKNFLGRANLEPDEIKFALKILVWQATNWQSATILDLNLTFFGGQFRNYISPAALPKTFDEPVLCTDYDSLPYVTKHIQAKERQLVLSSVHEFERELSTGNERRLSWQRCLYIIRSLEQQALQNGKPVPDAVFAEAIAATDLFFSLVVMIVQRHFPQFTYVALADLAAQDIADRHIRQAAENYVEKISKLFADHPAEEISRLLQNLQNFFTDNTEYIKWIETSQTNCTFFNQPLHVLSGAQEIIQSFSALTAAEDFGDPVLNYLLGRLGMEQYAVIPGDTNPAPEQKIKLEIIDGNIQDLLPPESLPAAVIMGSLPEIKDFYNSNYDALKQYASLYAQGYSGGSNKIMRNFGIKPESILLATNNLLLQQDGRRLKPKILIITEFPHENPNHPYTKALCQYWQDKFPHIQEILNVYLLYRMLKTCLHAGLETVYITAPRNDNDRYIHETLQKLPFLNNNPQT